MPKQAKGNGKIELWSDQRSGEVQYERESFPIGVPDNGRKINVFLGYRRSLDFDVKDNPGQDFAAVRGDDNGYLVGVVADGVSQSFYGHLAAYYLSETLLNTLWRRRERPPSEDDLERELKELEKKIAAEVVENHPIPDDLVPLLRESLEDKRSKGSQAVFAAFALDASKKRLHLYQVGDVGAIVHYANKEPEPIQAPPKGRWSSAGKSEMRLKLTTFDGYEDVSGIVIKSDGAGKDWGLKEKALTQNAFALLAEERAAIDDLSFVAARWGKVLAAPETEKSWPTGPVSPPRHEVEEAPPGTIRYPSPRRRKPPVRPPVVPPLPDYRPRDLLLLATGAVAVILMAFLGIAAYLAWGAIWDTAPEAQNDSNYTIEQGRRLSVGAPDGVLDNDTGADDDILEVADAEPNTPRRIDPVDRPSHGKVNLYSDGSFTYRPRSDFSGEDSFTYMATDGQRESDIAKVTVTVEATNGASNAWLPPQLREY